MEKYDAIIVGAGPGGLQAAKVLAENNKKVLVLEKNKKIERKICTGLWTLNKKTAEMNLPNSIYERKFKKIKITTPKRKENIILEKPFVSTINRKELSKWQHKQAKKAGAEILFDSNVQKINSNNVIVNNKKIEFKQLIGADGSSSIVRKSLRLKTDVAIGIQYWTKQKVRDLEIHLDAERFGPWYSWIAPHKNLTSIGAGAHNKWLPVNKAKKNLDIWCKENNIDIENAKFEGAPINGNYLGYKFKNKFLIGDAAGFASNLTGEGIYFAMASGEDVANIIINPKYVPRRINDILNIKKQHSFIENSFRINKTITEIEYELFLNLIKFRFIEKEVIEDLL